MCEAAVENAEIVASRHYDDVDEVEFGGMSVDVVLRARDSESAATLVERVVMSALWDVVGDREVGWTAHRWEATAAGAV
jgi:hypothetical protein